MATKQLMAKNDEEDQWEDEDVEEPADTNAVDARGLPLKKGGPPLPVPVFYSIMITVFTLVFVGLALAVYRLGATAKYDAKIRVLAGWDLGWLYIGFFIVKLGFVAVSVNLGMARQASKVQLPNQHAYKVYTPPGQAELGYVFMENEGDVGRFNRAQRSFMQYLEQAPVIYINFLLGGFVFTFPTFICGILFAIARVVAAVGYTSSTDGRGIGNMLAVVFSGVIEGFVIVSGVKALVWAN